MEIFLVGLVVQPLFSVTLVTLSVAAMLFVLDSVFTRSTGIYHADLGAPQFYDKLRFVRVLNLSVRWLDRLSDSLVDRFAC